jgi:hypothetical protein
MTIEKKNVNGKSQAIRLSKKLASGGLIGIAHDPWKIFEEGCRELSNRFMVKRIQPPLENRR